MLRGHPIKIGSISLTFVLSEACLHFRFHDSKGFKLEAEDEKVAMMKFD